MFLFESFAKVVIITQTCKYLALKMQKESEIIIYHRFLNNANSLNSESV